MPRNPRPLENILRSSEAVAALFTRVKQQAALLERVRAASDEQSAAAVKAALPQGSRLVLYAASPAWASRLRFSSRALQHRLAERGEPFDKITVRVTTASVDARPLPTDRQRLSASNSALIAATAEQIEDPELSAALERLARHRRS